MTVPSEVNPLLASSSDYTIARSVRTRGSALGNFTRNLAGASATTWTLSYWFKTGMYSATQTVPAMFDQVETTGLGRQIGIRSDSGCLSISKYAPSTYTCRKVTAQVFRDPSAWYHVVVVWNTTVATAEDRVQIYINGSRVTSWSTNTIPAQNTAWVWTYFTNSMLGQQNRDGSAYGFFDGYLAEVNFVDGQALTSSSFGVIDNNGIWQPKAYTGTYGTNGFYLKFSDNSAATAAAIGKDSSGNGNNWTPNNISVTAGATYDSMLDTPTVNYATWNPINHDAGTGTPVVARSLTDGNLGLAYDATNWSGYRSTFGMRSGKWYMEVNCSAGGGSFNTTLQLIDASQATGTAAIVGIQPTAGSNILAIALDVDNLTYSTYRNNTLISSGTIVPSSDYPEYMFRLTNGNGVNTFANFGQRPFTYTPPAGYNAVNSSNLSTPTVLSGAQYMAASTYTGTGTTLSVVNNGNNPAARSFQPDLVWLKGRSVAYNHGWFDSVRGVGKHLSSSTTGAEITNDVDGYLSAFNSNGFTLSNGTNSGATWNQNAATFVGWQWAAGQGTTTVNTSGTISSNVSVNQTAGFSIVTWTGTGASGATVGHGLSTLPQFVIIKKRNVSENWYVAAYAAQALNYAYHAFLNTTGALSGSNDPYLLGSQASLSSSVLALADGLTSNGGNQSGTTYVAYCWTPINGYSKFGSYTGNGAADGPFIYCGFTPRFILIKDTTSAVTNWQILDTSRNTYNQAINTIPANASSAEAAYGSGYGLDITSNGFKIRLAGSPINISTDTHIFAAFAENPFKISRAR